ncbi:unnamed protein product, partial [Closterium sp. NIES-53]
MRSLRTAQDRTGTVVARYSSPATAALDRLLLPYLFLQLSAFATVEDLVSHLRASDARYCAGVPAEFLDKNQPPMFITLYFIVTHLPDSLRSIRDHFLSLDHTSLAIDLLEQHLLAPETSADATSLLLRTSGLLLLVRSAAAARARVARVVEVDAAVVEMAAGVVVGAAVEVVAAVGLVEGVGALVAAVEAAGRSGGGGGSGAGGGGTGARRVGSVGGQRQQQQRRSETQSPQQLREWFFRGASGGSCLIAIFDLDIYAILSAIYALSDSAEGDCYRCVLLDPDIAAVALDSSEFGTLPGTAPAQALHTFTLDSSASACFFRDNTTLTPLPAPVPVKLADPSGARSLPVPPLFSRVWWFRLSHYQVFTSPRSLQT